MLRLVQKATRYMHSFANLIENPYLLAIKKGGGHPSLARFLNQAWIQSLDIATVLDIGANNGQFAFTISKMLPKAHLYAFEPLPDCFTNLTERLKNHNNFTAFNLGLSNRSGDLIIEHNNFSPSSSFLKMAELHKSAFPFTKNTHRLKVNVELLDTIAQTINIDSPMLIKIDVQGYEHYVLDGGEQTIRQAKIVMIETSFELLYEGQALFPQIYQTLTAWGFEYVGAIDQVNDPKDGRPLQEDSLFIKSEK